MKSALIVKLFFKISPVLIFLGTTLACSSGRENKESGIEQLPKPGVIHEKIACLSNKDISYALYIPSGKTENMITAADVTNLPNERSKALPGSSYPVILAFDPHGSGLLPVKMYRDLAERYGFILIGSNDSRNGQSGAVMNGIIVGLLSEIHAVYPIDTNRIYVAGFSGGSRVATLAAMSHQEVKGVIGCGAGFPGGTQPPLNKFDYFGIAGTADFNMNEMIQLNGLLTHLGMRNFITTFPGPHAWPPAGVMEEGFQWITLNAMKDGTLNRDNDAIARIMADFDARIAKAKHENWLIATAEACREAIQFADGLIAVENLKQELQFLEQLPEYKKQVAYRAKIFKKETTEQQLLTDAIFSKDEIWWKNRIQRMDSQHMKGLNPEDTLMNARLKAFLSLMCYSNANAAIKQRNREMAKTVITVYKMADPQNPEPNYMHAVILLQGYDTTAAIRQLEIAIDKGFLDKPRMIQQREFLMLKNSPAWFDLLQKMK